MFGTCKGILSKNIISRWPGLLLLLCSILQCITKCRSHTYNHALLVISKDSKYYYLETTCKVYNKDGNDKATKALYS